jgi:2-keto-4-pentenoate hydratase/2-oxohepta-3-ene-1,7-dioic acid hydratase in catechol pathway
VTSPFNKISVPPIALNNPTIDYECELVVIIGKTCKNVKEDKALDHVLGYAVGNDISHRDWQLQLGGGQWNYGKSFDGFAPYGPGIVRPEALGNKDPGQCTQPSTGLKIWTKVNGETVQEGWTGDMIFNVAQTISFLSQGTTLNAGSIIFMGTPAGVGMSRNPPRWLKDGDVVEVGLESIGSCINSISFYNGEKRFQNSKSDGNDR